MIGICTPFKLNNYGTKLQAYAVQHKIRELGFDYEIINFNRRSDLRPSKLYDRYCNWSFISSKFDKLFKSDSPSYKLNMKIRNDAISSFDRSHYKLTREIRGYKNLVNYAKKYDALICGSDQIWSPSAIKTPISTLEFGNDNVRKVSFSTSFGVSEIPNNKRKKYKKFLQRFDYVSVRETSGVEIVRDISSKEATVLLDPTLSVNRSLWDKLSSDSRIKINGDYLFCYFLGTNEVHRKKAYDLAKRKNLKIVTLAHFKCFNKCDEFYSDIQLYDVTPCDFVSLIKNAEIICTDSFHGSVFSILYHKNFYTFERFSNNNKLSTNSRIYSLFSLLKIKNRIVSKDNNYIFNNEIIDYNMVDKRLSFFRKETDNFLKKAFHGIKKKDDEKATFQKLCDDKCCGCTACKSICPKNCITMIRDKYGFSYPRLINSSDCIHCNLCNSVCPNKKELNIAHSISEPKFVISSDADVRKKSSSGGIFYVIANYVLSKSGMVCGAMYDSNFDVKHVIIDDQKGLIKLIGSKYSESYLGDIFIQIKRLLDKGTLLLFAGTPCQVHGLKSFLLKDYDNLITVDLLCYGIQAPLAWSKYKNYITQNNKKEITNINMRDKTVSWQNYSMKIQFKNEKSYISGKNSDPYLRSYSKGLFIRPSCYNCDLKAFPRRSDITIGDFWDIDDISPQKNDHLGASILFANSTIGEKIINNLKDNNSLLLEDIDKKKLAIFHPFYGLSAKKNKNSGKFEKLLFTNNDFNCIVKKCEDSFFRKKARKLYRYLKNRRR